MDILKELLYENISPYGRKGGLTDEQKSMLNRIIEADARLLHGMPDKKAALLEECIELRTILNEANDIQLFSEGFRLGAQFMLAALQKTDI